MWLQEFAWGEADKPNQVAARNRQEHVRGEAEDSEKLQAELTAQPMFCFETAMNMLYWSALVHDCDEVSPLECVLPVLPWPFITQECWPEAQCVTRVRYKAT